MSIQSGETVLAGRYRLDEVIGRGGMSTVYRATDQVLGRPVAVKILLAALAEQDPTYAERFEREARAAAGLDNPAVVTIYDTGVDDGRHYIVMEHVAGRSLEQIIRGGSPVTVPEAARIAAAVADALAAAHAAGIMHRDIKPANVMLTAGGAVKVLDFGIARSVDGTAITQVASVVGTAAYMAPERALGKPGDARADIYSLGCLLYALLTGGPPFTGEVSAAVLHQQINVAARAPGQTRPGIPPELDALVLAMLAKSPDQRPAPAAAVRDLLERFAEGPATSAPAPPAAAAAPLIGVPTAPARAGLMADHRRRAIVMALLTAAITLLAVALLSAGGASHNAKAPARRAPSHSAPAVTHATPPAQTQPPASSASPPPPGQGDEPPGPAKKGKDKKPGGDGKDHGGGGGGGD